MALIVAEEEGDGLATTSTPLEEVRPLTSLLQHASSLTLLTPSLQVEEDVALLSQLEP